MDIIVSLLEPDDIETGDVLRTAIDALFSDHWKVKKWFDLQVFSSADVAVALTPTDSIPVEVTAPVIVKKLGLIVDYSRVGCLSDDLTMQDIVKILHTHSLKPAFTSGCTSTPTSPARRSVQFLYNKKSVPTLDKFTGVDEDYFDWKESTIKTLGTAGFQRFWDDAAVITKHQEIAESVFYSLRSAVRGGQAQSIAQRMLDDKTLDPSALWSALERYYDTDLNRANVALFNSWRLFLLRLDPDTTASKFISDYCDCIQRLRKNNVSLAEDKNTLRAFLLASIQDDNFEMVRDMIIHKPHLDVDTILNELRERELALNMKDQHSSSVGGNGSTSTRYSRRTQQTNSTTKKVIKHSGSATSGTFHDKQWSIPRYPDSWKKALGGSLFKMLLDWRTDAHKGKSQAQLLSDYETVVEKVQRSGKSGGGGLVKSKSTSPTTTTDADTPITGDDAPNRKQIRLQKSRRVVTERSA